jgi:hypothetical protein
MYRRFFHKCYLERIVFNSWRRRSRRKTRAEEVRMVEVSINAKQAIAIIWTLFAFGLSLAVVLTLGTYYYTPGQWQMQILLFFALMLIIVLPAYLFLALWQITSKSESA